MEKSRKKITYTLNSVRSLHDKYEYLEKEFVRLHGELEYKKIKDFYLESIDKLEQEKQALPIGFRYEGVFYVKVPYSMPLEVEKITGAAFMREDLVSWIIESGLEDLSKYGYCRIIYKDRKLQEEITRQDCEPVYETAQESKV